jgi:hypothetical protein
MLNIKYPKQVHAVKIIDEEKKKKQPMRKGGQETGARNFGISAPSLTHSVHKNIKNK